MKNEDIAYNRPIILWWSLNESESKFLQYPYDKIETLLKLKCKKIKCMQFPYFFTTNYISFM